MNALCRLLQLIILGVYFMAISLLSGCSSGIEYYKDENPKLDLQNYLDGRIDGSGIIEDWKGNVVKKFDFIADASWKDGVCTLDEHMIYYDDSKDHRIWTIKKINDHYYEGQTKDVIGIAKIHVQGNAMNWQYTMDVKVGNSTYRLNFDDWMFLMHNDVLINKNYFKKFGLTVGSLTLFMHKKGLPKDDKNQSVSP